MAIVKMPQSATLALRVQTGISGTGAPVFKNVNFSSIKTAAPEANLYAVAQSLSTLQNHTLVAINRTETSSLIEQ